MKMIILLHLILSQKKYQILYGKALKIIVSLKKILNTFHDSDFIISKKNGYQMALIGSALMKSTQPKRVISEYLKHGRGKK